MSRSGVGDESLTEEDIRPAVDACLAVDQDKGVNYFCGPALSTYLSLLTDAYGAAWQFWFGVLISICGSLCGLNGVLDFTTTWQHRGPLCLLFTAESASKKSVVEDLVVEPLAEMQKEDFIHGHRKPPATSADYNEQCEKLRKSSAGCAVLYMRVCASHSLLTLCLSVCPCLPVYVSLSISL